MIHGNNAQSCSLLFLLTFVVVAALGCERETPPLMCVTVRNNTSSDFRNVTLTGDGFPGELGNLVAGGYKSFSDYTKAVGPEVEVSWRVKGSELVHRQKLAVPKGFTVDGDHQLSIEIFDNEQVTIKSELKPGK